MMRCCSWLAALALAPLACAQLALYTVEPERRVGNQLNLGSVPAGDALSARLRLRNGGTTEAAVTFLTISGAGFRIDGAPALPVRLAPGEALDFNVRLEASMPGGYSASLRADGVSAILLSSVLPAPAVLLAADNGWTPLASGMAVDFGSVEPGAAITRRFAISNGTGGPLPPVEVAVSPGVFAIEPRPGAAIPLAPGETFTFAVVCRPTAAGQFTAELSAGARRFLLRAVAVEPPLPQPEIVVDLAEARSLRQGRVSVRLASASRARATGELRLDFQPAPGLGPDPAIVFASGSLSVPFTIAEGDAAVRFGSSAYVDFQTGSTAGTLVFSVDAGSRHERRTLAIAPAAAGITATRVSRGQASVEVQIQGFDNTRSLGRLSFSFFEHSGATVASGAVPVDAAADFHRYFETSGMGGVFLLRAVFPVSGGVERIESVEAELVNAAGAARTGTLRF